MSIKAFRRRQDRIISRFALLVFLLLVVFGLCLFALCIQGQALLRFPSVGILDQPRDIPRQPDLPGQQLPGAPQQPLAVYGKTARVKGVIRPVQHRTGRFPQRAGPVGARMAVQPADPLEQQVHRTQLGHQKVKINVQRLLQHLCTDHDQPVPLRRGGPFTQPAEQLLLPLRTVRHQKLRMEQQNRVLRQGTAQHLRQSLRFFDRIDDDAGAAALTQTLPQQIRQRLLLYGKAPHGMFLLHKGHRPLVHLPAVGPGEQRVPPALLPITLCSGAEIRPDQFAAPFGGQRGRQQDDRDMVAAQPGQSPVQIAVHIRIVGMAFVHHNDLAGQAQMPQHHMLLLQSGQQQLVHRAEDKIRQKRLLAPLEPGVNHHAARLRILLGDRLARDQLPVLFVQFGCAVGQPDGVLHLPGLRLRPPLQPVKEPVCGRLCGQAEKHPAFVKPLRKDLRCGQRRLRLSHAHLCLQDQDTRRRSRGRHFEHRPLDRVGGKAKALPEPLLVHLRPGGIPHIRQGQRLPCPFQAGRVEPFVSRPLHRHKREIPAVAGDPVGHRQQAGEQQLRGKGQLRQLAGIVKAAFRQRLPVQFLPDGLPLAFLSFPPVV